MKIINILSPQILAIEDDKKEVLVWSLCNLTKKKMQNKCLNCNNQLTRKAYLPITNGYNRMERICCDCISEMIVDYSKLKKDVKEDTEVKG